MAAIMRDTAGGNKIKPLRRWDFDRFHRGSHPVYRDLSLSLSLDSFLYRRLVKITGIIKRERESIGIHCITQNVLRVLLFHVPPILRSRCLNVSH